MTTTPAVGIAQRKKPGLPAGASHAIHVQGLEFLNGRVDQMQKDQSVPLGLEQRQRASNHLIIVTT